MGGFRLPHCSAGGREPFLGVRGPHLQALAEFGADAALPCLARALGRSWARGARHKLW